MRHYSLRPPDGSRRASPAAFHQPLRAAGGHTRHDL